MPLALEPGSERCLKDSLAVAIMPATLYASFGPVSRWTLRKVLQQSLAVRMLVCFGKLLTFPD